MNYLAHLFLSKTDDHSLVGNLLGDFMNGWDVEDMPPGVLAGLQNHRAIDGYTDSHSVVRELRTLFSPERRRFAGIILDVAFDHYLLKHWDQFSSEDLDSFFDRVYESLNRTMHLMPERMQLVVTSMLSYRWLDTYRELDGVGFALDRMSQRLRVKNALPGSITEVKDNDVAIDSGFCNFFPDLLAFVAERDRSDPPTNNKSK